MTTDTKERFEITCEVAKVHDELGIVLGWALVCKDDSDLGFHIDMQRDAIPEMAMLKAAVGFAEGGRMAKEMHTRDGAGTVLFMLPLTTDIAKALGLVTRQTGLIIGMKPDAEMLEKFRDGTLTGFSIGGRRVKDTPKEIEVS